MDNKIIKTQIFNSETVLNKTSEQPIDVDFSLPEYYPDISKILKCRCVPRISSKGVNGNSITAEGTAVITVIYIDDENMLNSYEYRYPFSKSFEASGINGGACICVTVTTDYINCRAVTARKVDIHGALSVTAVVSEKKPMEIISDVDISGVAVLKDTISADTPLSCNEKSVSVEEDIEIGSGLKDINCLIRYDGAVNIREAKLIAGKAMLKGELSLDILYCNDGGELGSLKEKLPFSQMIETESAGENCSIDTAAELSVLEIKPKSDSEGKTRSFSVNAKILLSAEAYCKNDITAVLDAYSRKYKTEIEKSEQSFTGIIDNINASFTVKQGIDFEGMEISRVADLWCSPKIKSVKTENGNIAVEGVLTVSIILNDADGVPDYYEKEIPFDYSYSLQNGGDNLYAEPVASPISVSYTLLGAQTVEVRAELSLTGAVLNCERKSIVTDINVDYEKPAEKRENCAMVVYCAQKGERVWDIASRYLSDTEEIKKINELEDDYITSDKMILIPLL